MILSREEFCLTVLHQWGAGTADCRNALEEHDAEQRARIAQLEALAGEDKLHLFERLKNEERKAINRETAGCKSCRAEIEALRAERDAAQRESGISECNRKSAEGALSNIARVLGADVAGIPEAIDAAIETARELREKLAAETGRLNFLDRLGFSTVRNGRGEGPKDDPGIHSWRQGNEWNWTAAWIGSNYGNAREAIDAAMSAADQEQR